MVLRALGVVALFLSQTWMPRSGAAPLLSQISAPALPAVCEALPLKLQPGTLDATGALKTPAASDIPLDPVVAEVPLQSGSVASHLTLPLSPTIPPVLLAKQYLKTSVAEYVGSSAMPSSVTWYKAKFRKCGFTLRSYGTSSNGRTGLSATTYDFVSPTTPSLNVRLTLERSPAGGSLLLFYAWAITLPARPQSSLVTGDVRSIRVKYVLPSGKKAWNVTLTSTGNIAAITSAVNMLSQDVGVHTCFGSLQQATLHIRQGSKTSTYSVVPGCFDVFAGRQLRLLDSDHAVWNAVRAAVYDYCLGHRCKQVVA